MRIGCGDINLPELEKELIIRSEDLHHPPPFIRDHP
jgi:hypothetical protein